MSWQQTVYVYPLLVGTAVAVLLAAYTATYIRREGRDPVLVVFFWLMVCLALWSGFSTLKLASTDPATKLLFYQFLHLGVAPLGALLVLFALAYTDRQRWLRPSVVAALFVVPVGYALVLAANPAGLAWTGTNVLEVTDPLGHEIVVKRAESGLFHLLYVGFTTSCVLVALALIGTEAAKLGRAYVPQALLLTVAIVAPTVAGTLAAFGIPPFDPDGVNLVPVSSTLVAVAIAVAVYRYRWFELPPIAYATVVQESPDGVFVLDRTDRVVHANDRGTEILAQLETSVGERLDAAVFRAADETDAGHVEHERPGGSKAVFDVRSQPIERGGRTVGRVVVLADVTERHEHQQRLAAQNDQLDQFASIVSHDLRNPLNVAQLYVQSERRERDSENLERTAAALGRIESIVEDTLTLARDGTQVTTFERESLERLVRTSWAHVETGDATLEIVADADLECDPARIHNLFENLFRNSVEHGSTDPGSQARRSSVEHGSTSLDSEADTEAVSRSTFAREDSVPGRAEPRASVTVRVGPLDGGFFVEDDGPGIPEDERDTVFDRGYTTGDGGTGFGLAIVDRIADGHGWTLTLTESESGGARFEFAGVAIDPKHS